MQHHKWTLETCSLRDDHPQICLVGGASVLLDCIIGVPIILCSMFSWKGNTSTTSTPFLLMMLSVPDVLFHIFFAARLILPLMCVCKIDGGSWTIDGDPQKWLAYLYMYALTCMCIMWSVKCYLVILVCADRYFAIRKETSMYNFCSVRKLRFYIVIIWVTAFVMHMPRFYEQAHIRSTVLNSQFLSEEYNASVTASPPEYNASVTASPPEYNASVTASPPNLTSYSPLHAIQGHLDTDTSPVNFPWYVVLFNIQSLLIIPTVVMMFLFHKLKKERPLLRWTTPEEQQSEQELTNVLLVLVIILVPLQVVVSLLMLVTTFIQGNYDHDKASTALAMIILIQVHTKHFLYYVGCTAYRKRFIQWFGCTVKCKNRCKMSNRHLQSEEQALKSEGRENTA